jgi:hypothetical protein
VAPFRSSSMNISLEKIKELKYVIPFTIVLENVKRLRTVLIVNHFKALP